MFWTSVFVAMHSRTLLIRNTFHVVGFQNMCQLFVKCEWNSVKVPMSGKLTLGEATKRTTNMRVAVVYSLNANLV